MSNNRLMLDFGDNEHGELMLRNVRKVLRANGVTQKRAFLIGLAMQFEDNPEFVTQIAEYLNFDGRAK